MTSGKKNGGPDRPDHPDTGPLTVTVENEDSGRDIVLRVGRGETVQKAIDELYRELGRGPDPEDRLTCGTDGASVLPFAAEKIKDFLEHCPDLVWRFVGRTGGATDGGAGGAQ